MAVSIDPKLGSSSGHDARNWNIRMGYIRIRI